MSPLNREALEPAKKSLRIRDVYFRDEKVTVDPSVTPPFWPSHGNTQFRMATRILRDFDVEESDGDEVEAGVRKHLLEVEFLGAVRCLSELGDAESELLSMEVSIGLLYEMRTQCEEASVDEFVRMNVPYHAIPYWREYVHSVCARRGFPLITVPLYTKAQHLIAPLAVAEGDVNASSANGEK